MNLLKRIVDINPPYMIIYFVPIIVIEQLPFLSMFIELNFRRRLLSHTNFKKWHWNVLRDLSNGQNWNELSCLFSNAWADRSV